MGEVTKVENSPTSVMVTVKGVTEERTYEQPFSLSGGPVRVKEGDHVNYGDKIFDGVIDIRDLLKVAGIERVRMYLLKEIQKVYRLQGIEISDRYIEVIIRQLTNKVQITNPQDSEYFIGQIITINEYNEVCKKLFAEHKQLPTAINLVFSIDDVPSLSESFLSAASRNTGSRWRKP